jgi:hypothetical protein
MNQFSKKWLPPLIALIIVVVLGIMAIDPHLSEGKIHELASHYRFAPPVTLLAPSNVKMASVRRVHPSLERISGWISSVGASAALGDIDGDGAPNDLCDVDPRTNLVTVRPVPNTGSRYAAFTLDVGVLRYNADTMAPMGCLLGDVNEDGWLDIVVYFWGRTPIAYLQLPNRAPLTKDSFKAVELVDSEERWFTNSAGMADFDGDGHIDILFANYFPDGSDILNANGAGVQTMHDTMSKSFNGGRKHFLLWKESSGGTNPSVRFNHVAPFNDPAIDKSWTLAVAAADLDGDGLPEIYLANDFGADRLLHNKSKPGQLAFDIVEGTRGFFTPKSATLGEDSFKGMGAEIGDINGDGLPDIMVSNIAAPYSLQESHMAWVNTGEKDAFDRGVAPFVQLSEKLGLSRSGWGWDIKLADLNNDGVPEVVQATGFMKGKVNRWAELQALATSNDRLMSNPEFWPKLRLGDDLSGHQSNPIFARSTDGRYYDIAGALNLAETWVTRGVAIADVDGDGLLDIVYANQWEPSVYIHNECKDCGDFLGIRLVRERGGTLLVEHKDRQPLRLSAAIGAKVTLHTSDGHLRTAQIDGGNGHSGRRSPEIHFGLGRAPVSSKQKVLVEWRGFDGTSRSATIELSPGWHTLVLGS